MVDILKDIELELNAVEVNIPNSATSVKNFQARLAEPSSIWPEENDVDSAWSGSEEVASPPASPPYYTRDICPPETALQSSDMIADPSHGNSQAAYHMVTTSVDEPSTISDPQVSSPLSDDYALPAITQEAPKETTAYGWMGSIGHWRCGGCEVYQHNPDEKVHDRANGRWICCSCGGGNSCLLDVGCANCG